MALAWWRRRRPAEVSSKVDLWQLKRFSLHELQVATNNFSDRHILGRGGFGKVYKGRLADGTLVAVKRIKEATTQGGELQFQTEVEIISMAVHRNLLRLRGFCMTPTERLLVYPFMANGSVASCLRERPENQEENTEANCTGVKGLLREKKLEILVDADLKGNYIDAEVEQLIQVVLLCTQGTPLERPKMSEVVRMLEGDGLAERWEEWQKEEMFRQEFNPAHNPNTDWITADSDYDELSGPR
ncbi:hypothetical protein L1987_85463 [Smallanthus sonchifolius]|uniref:Uncharacterized protein n=1 Tax=Smallanthus sonchifolius TaxID=185202 RepID=A0ACB8XWJ3_9ASTR|nr:hypothetical protein L1987_85463 [Smallanthus sonchifolius]